MELDRQLHPLGRFAEALITAQLGPQVPQTGWLALVSNGAGGVWFDVTADYPEALAVTQEAIEDVMDDVDDVGFNAEDAIGRGGAAPARVEGPVAPSRLDHLPIERRALSSREVREDALALQLDEMCAEAFGNPCSAALKGLYAANPRCRIGAAPDRPAGRRPR